MIKSLSILTVFAISALALGCGGGEPADNPSPAAPLTETSGEVIFEPAYPEEVSTEGLSAEDAAQQQTHRHADGEVHAHDEKSSTTTDHGHDH